METDEQRFNKLRQKCWNKALHSFGLSYVFDMKAQSLNKFTNLLKVFGIVVPVTVGATAMGYGIDSVLLKNTIALAIPLTIAQLIFSVFAVVNKWDDELAYAYEASQDLSLMSDSFEKLADLPPENIDELNVQYELLNTRYKARTQQNSKHYIKEWELRRSMRSALRQFQRKCVGCNQVPTSMDSTDCDVCGKYDKSIFFKLIRARK